MDDVFCILVLVFHHTFDTQRGKLRWRKIPCLCAKLTKKDDSDSDFGASKMLSEFVKYSNH